MSQEIVELAYSRFAQHYSKKNWWSNQPLWNTLIEEDKEFWSEFIKSVQANFGLGLVKPSSKVLNVMTGEVKHNVTV